MTILLTGSTGFIGSRVKALLSDRDVVCFGGDLNDVESYQYAIRALRPVQCIHTAWEGLPDRSSKRSWLNLNAQRRFLDLLVPNCERLVVTGSCFEYGDIQGLAQEDMWPPLTDEFAIAKRALSVSVWKVARWARVFYVYPNRLTTWARAWYRDNPNCTTGFQADNPELACDWISADDVARGLVALLDADCESGAYNLASGQPRAVGEVVNTIARRFGKPEPYPGIKATSGFWADMTKTKAATGFECQVSFEP